MHCQVSPVKVLSVVWWHVPIFLVVRRPRLEDHPEFKTGLELIWGGGGGRGFVYFLD